MTLSMLDPYGNEVLIDDPFVPPPTDADVPFPSEDVDGTTFNADDDRLEELLSLSLLSLQLKTSRGGMRHE